LALLVRWEHLGRQVHLDSKAAWVPRERLELQVLQAARARQASQARLVTPGPQVPLARLGLTARPELVVRPEVQALQDLKVLLDLSVQSVLMDSLEDLVLQEIRD